MSEEFTNVDASEEKPAEQTEQKKAEKSRFNTNWKEERKRILDSLADKEYDSPEEVWKEYARQRGFDDEEIKMLYALRHVESGGNVKAKSSAGARGAFQFMPETAKKYGIADVEDEAQSGIAATDYLIDLYEKFRPYAKDRAHAWNLALQGYNAGETRIQKELDAGREPSISADYVNAIFSKMKEESPEGEAKEAIQIEAPEGVEVKPGEVVKLELPAEESGVTIHGEFTPEEKEQARKEVEQKLTEYSEFINRQKKGAVNPGETALKVSEIEAIKSRLDVFPAEERAKYEKKLDEYKQTIQSQYQPQHDSIIATNPGAKLWLYDVVIPLQAEFAKTGDKSLFDRRYTVGSYTPHYDDFYSPEAINERIAFTRQAILGLVGNKPEIADEFIKEWGKQSNNKFVLLDEFGQPIERKRGQPVSISFTAGQLMNFFNKMGGAPAAAELKQQQEEAPLKRAGNKATALQAFVLGATATNPLAQIALRGIGVSPTPSPTFLSQVLDKDTVKYYALGQLASITAHTAGVGALSSAASSLATGAIAKFALGMLPVVADTVLQAALPRHLEYNKDGYLTSYVYDEKGRRTERTWADVLKDVGKETLSLTAITATTMLGAPAIIRPFMTKYSETVDSVVTSLAAMYKIPVEQTYRMLLTGGQASANVFGDLISVAPMAAIKAYNDGKMPEMDELFEMATQAVLSGAAYRRAGIHTLEEHTFEAEGNYYKIGVTNQGITFDKLKEKPVGDIRKVDSVLDVYATYLTHLSVSNNTRQRELAEEFSRKILGEYYGRSPEVDRRIKEQVGAARRIDFDEDGRPRGDVTAAFNEEAARLYNGRLFRGTPQSGLENVLLEHTGEVAPNGNWILKILGTENRIELPSEKLQFFREAPLNRSLDVVEGTLPEGRLLTTALVVQHRFSPEGKARIDEALLKALEWRQSQKQTPLGITRAASFFDKSSDGKLLYVTHGGEGASSVDELNVASAKVNRKNFPVFTEGTRATATDLDSRIISLLSPSTSENIESGEPLTKESADELNRAYDILSAQTAIRFDNAQTVSRDFLLKLAAHLPKEYQSVIASLPGDRVGVVNPEKIAFALNAAHESVHVQYGAFTLDKAPQAYEEFLKNPSVQRFREFLEANEGREVTPYVLLQEALAYGSTGELLYRRGDGDKIELLSKKDLDEAYKAANALFSKYAPEAKGRVLDELRFDFKMLRDGAAHVQMDVGEFAKARRAILMNLESLNHPSLRDVFIMTPERWDESYRDELTQLERVAVLSAAGKDVGVAKEGVYETGIRFTVGPEAIVQDTLKRITDEYSPETIGTDFRRAGFYSPLHRFIQSKLKGPIFAGDFRRMIEKSPLKKTELDDIRLTKYPPDSALQRFVDTLDEKPRTLSELLRVLPGNFKLNPFELQKIIELNYPVISEVVYGTSPYLVALKNELVRIQQQKESLKKIGFEEGWTDERRNALSALMDETKRLNTMLNDSATVKRLEENSRTRFGLTQAWLDEPFTRAKNYAELVVRDANNPNITSKESHFSETGVIGWIRQHYEPADETYYVHEIQSDYAKIPSEGPRPIRYEVREEETLSGTKYRIYDETGQWDSKLFDTKEEAERVANTYASLATRLIGAGYRVHEDTWPKLLFNRALLHASRIGAKKIAITTGETQIKRWRSIPEDAVAIEFLSNSKFAFVDENGYAISATDFSQPRLVDTFGGQFGRELWEAYKNYVIENAKGYFEKNGYKLERTDKGDYIIRTPKGDIFKGKTFSNESDAYGYFIEKNEEVLYDIFREKPLRVPLKQTEDVRSRDARNATYFTNFYDKTIRRMMRQYGEVRVEQAVDGNTYYVIDNPEITEFPLYRITDSEDTTNALLKTGTFALVGDRNTPALSNLSAQLHQIGLPQITLSDGGLLVPYNVTPDKLNQQEALIAEVARRFGEKQVIFGRYGKYALRDLDKDTNNEIVSENISIGKGRRSIRLNSGEDVKFHIDFTRGRTTTGFDYGRQFADWKRSLNTEKVSLTSYELYQNSKKSGEKRPLEQAAIYFTKQVNPNFDETPIYDLQNKIKRGEINIQQANKRLDKVYPLQTPSALLKLTDDAYRTVKSAFENKDDVVLYSREFYTTDMGRFWQKMEELHPGITQNATAQRALLTLMAITSLNATVPTNLSHSARYYDTFFSTAVLNTPPDELKGYRANMAKFLRLLTDTKKPEWLYDSAAWQRIKELRDKAGIAGVIEALSMPSNGQATLAQQIFGPKLGAYLLNLHGYLDLVTIDRWQNRWLARILGKPVRFSGKETNPVLEPNDILSMGKTEKQELEEAGETKTAKVRKDTIYQRLGSAAIVAAAEKLRGEGINITPVEVQAILWAIERKIWGDFTNKNQPMEMYAKSLIELEKKAPKTQAALEKQYQKDVKSTTERYDEKIAELEEELKAAKEEGNQKKIDKFTLQLAKKRAEKETKLEELEKRFKKETELLTTEGRIKPLYQVAEAVAKNETPLTSAAEVSGASIEDIRGRVISRLQPEEVFPLILYRSADEHTDYIENLRKNVYGKALAAKYPELAPHIEKDDFISVYVALKDNPDVSPVFWSYIYESAAKLLREDANSTYSKKGYGDNTAQFNVNGSSLSEQIRLADLQSPGFAFPRLSHPAVQPFIDEVVSTFLKRPNLADESELSRAILEAIGFDSYKNNDAVVPLRLFKMEGLIPEVKQGVTYSRVIESPSFIDFFGDWTVGQGSKVVDENGVPKVVFHGTTSDFAKFDVNKLSAQSMWGKGIYASDSADEAYQYSREPRGKETEDFGFRGVIRPLYMNIRNPFITRFGIQEPTRWSREEVQTFVRLLKQNIENYSTRFSRKVFDAIDDIAADYNRDNVVASDLVLRLNSAPEVFAVYKDGEGFVFNETLRQALEQMGYDGIIDNITGAKSTHYIAFSPAQARSALAARDEVLHRVTDMPETVDEWLDYARKRGISDEATLSAIRTIVESGQFKPGKIMDIIERSSVDVQRFIADLYRANLLASASTQTMNLKANLLQMPLRELTEIVSIAPDIGLQVLGGLLSKSRANIHVNLPAVLDGLKGIKIGVSEAWDEIKSAITGKPRVTPETIVAGVPPKLPMHTGIEFLDKTAGRYIDTVYAITGSMDSPFFQFYYEQARKSIISELKKKNPSMTTEEIAEMPQVRDYAFRVAMVATWKNDNLASLALSSFRERLPAPLKFLLNTRLPFIKTGSNIAIELADYATFGLAGHLLRGGSANQNEVLSLREKILNVLNEPTARRQVSYAIGQGLTGYGLMLLGYYLAKNNIIEFIPWYDEDDKQTLKIQSKNGAYMSIKLGGYYHRVSQIPLAYPLVAGARYYYLHDEKGRDFQIRDSILDYLQEVALQSPYGKFIDNYAQTKVEKEAGLSYSLARYGVQVARNLVLPRAYGEIIKTAQGNIRKDLIVRQHKIDEKTGKEVEQLNIKDTLMNLLLEDTPWGSSKLYVSALGDTVNIANPFTGATLAREAPAADWLYKIDYNPKTHIFIAGKKVDLPIEVRQALKMAYTELALDEQVRSEPPEIQRAVAARVFDEITNAYIRQAKLRTKEVRQKALEERKGVRRSLKEVPEVKSIVRRVLRGEKVE
jgi:hypothetical protein